MEKKRKIQPIPAETLAAIRRKSAYNLPDRPSERGMKPAEIKQAIAGPVTDSENSVLSELQRVVTEANEVFENLNDEVDTILPDIEEGDEGKILQVKDGKWSAVKIEYVEDGEF